MWSMAAIAVAASAYYGATRFIFPMIGEKHHDSDDAAGSAAAVSASVVGVNWHLALLLGLSCAVATAVPGLFTISCVASGYALGFGVGAAVCVSSVFMGLLVSFELGRTCFRERASALVQARFPSAHSLSQMHPTRAIWLTWFLPVPLAIKIFFWASCSNVSLPRFLASAAVVAVPQLCTLVLIGDQAASLSDKPSGAHEKILFGLGVLSVVVVGAAISRAARNSVAASAAAEEKP